MKNNNMYLLVLGLLLVLAVLRLVYRMKKLVVYQKDQS